MATQQETAFPVHHPPSYGSPNYVYQQIPAATTIDMTPNANYTRPNRSATRSSGDKDEDTDTSGKSFVASEKYLDIEFDACFYENKGAHTIPQVYTAYGLVYKYTNLIIYNLLVIFFGAPLAVLWGITFSITSFGLTWIWNPSMKLVILAFGVTIPIVTEPLKALLGPIVDVHARIFRQIQIKLTKDKTPAQTA